MANHNYTREILAQIRAGRVPVSSVGPTYLVTYAPRRKYDPQPWVSGAYRYNGREVHTVAPCGKPLLSMKHGRMVACELNEGHERSACRTVTGGYIRYTYS